MFIYTYYHILITKHVLRGIKGAQTSSQANVVSIYKHQWHAYMSYTCYKHIHRNICICISQQTTDSSDRLCIFYVSCDINPPHCSTDCFLKINTWHIGTGVPHASGLFAAFFLKIQPHQLWKSSSDQHWFTDWRTETLIIFFGSCDIYQEVCLPCHFLPEFNLDQPSSKKTTEHWGAALHSRFLKEFGIRQGWPWTRGSPAQWLMGFHQLISYVFPVACL